MRGKGSIACSVYLLYGITPAYAGKSAKYFFEAFFWEDHPRLCGEKQPCRLAASTPQGSPPPMRGKVTAPVAEGVKRGITPAYAGKRCHEWRKSIFW